MCMYTKDPITLARDSNFFVDLHFLLDAFLRYAVLEASPEKRIKQRNKRTNW